MLLHIFQIISHHPLLIAHIAHGPDLLTSVMTPARVVTGLWVFRVILRYFVTAALGHFSPGYHRRVESIKPAKNVHGGITSDAGVRGGDIHQSEASIGQI